MNKLFLIIVLLVSSACACLARSTESEPIFAIYPEDSLTLKYILGCENKDCFIKFRLITRSTDVWKEGDRIASTKSDIRGGVVVTDTMWYKKGGDELIFTCKDGTQQSITCDNSLDDNGFHVVHVKTPVFAHMLTGISAINLKRSEKVVDMQLLPYTSSKTRNGVNNLFQKTINDIKKQKIDSLFHVENSIKYPKFTDFSYIKGCHQVSTWVRQDLRKQFFFAWDEYKKNKKALNK